MVPSGPGTPIGGAQHVNPSLLRSNSGMLSGQGGSMPSQGGFPSLISPRNQFNNGNMLGNVPNVSSLLNQSFGNNGPGSGIPGNGPRGGIDGGAESDPLSGMVNGMGFNPSSSFVAQNMGNPGSSDQVQGQQFSSTSGSQMLTDQPLHGGLSGVGPVKMEPQINNDQHGPSQQNLQGLRGLGQVKMEQQSLPSMRGLGQVKMEQQSLPSMRGLGPVKMEPQHLDPSLFLQQQHQQHQLLQQMSMSRPSSQTAAAQLNLLQQQRLLQMQQQQQQQNQLMKAIPQPRPQLQQQLLPHNMPLRQSVKPYEPGMGARRLTHYMYQQQHRPEDNNIDFWRNFVAEYFAPNAKKKWCVSMYGSSRQTTGVFPQDVWHCEICKRKPGRGFEATVEVLPRLFKIKYESGTLEELLYVDMPHESQNSSGQIVLDYAKAIQESVFDQLRVVRDGQLRIVFSPDLKICSWEFCARRHEELIPRRLLIPQVSQLGNAAQKYQAATQTSSSNMSVSDLQSNCNMFVASARHLAKALEVPLVNDLGYTKRYVRCLQISEVVNSMKDLIDYSRLTGTGPMDSLIKFPRRTVAQSSPHGLSQHPDEQQQQQQPQPQAQAQAQPHQLQQLQQAMMQGSNNNNQNCVQSGPMQIASNNGVAAQNNAANASSASTSHSTIAGLLHQNSMNSRQQNPICNASSPFGGSSVQMSSPGSSTTIQAATQPNPSPFQSPTPSFSNNPPQTNHINSANSPALSNIQQPTLSNDGDTNETQNSVHKMIQDMVMNNQINGILPTGRNPVLNGANCLVGNGPTSGSNLSMGGRVSFGGMGRGMGQASVVNGVGEVMGNRVGMPSMVRDQSMAHHPQDLGNQMLGELGAVNGFNGVQFDWKSP